MLHQNNQNIIVIGASAGGVLAVSKLVAKFSKAFNAAIFIVIHVPSDSRSDIILREIQKHTILPCVLPTDGQEISTNTIYLAPADHQMLLVTNKIIIKKGPYENHWRPAIDVLFRSAAASYGQCVTGIILTGLLDDGTSGMIAIKKVGGKVMIQDPAEADFADMPESVLHNVDVDYAVPIDEMGYILTELYARAECEVGEIPADVKKEAEITLRMSSNVKELEEIGEHTSLTCPSCGGTLLKISNEKVPRYRCYTGHSYNENALEYEQIKGIEDSIWVAIRMMEERRNLLNSMQSHNASAKTERAAQIKIHIDRLKKMLLGLNDPLNNENEN